MANMPNTRRAEAARCSRPAQRTIPFTFRSRVMRSSGLILLAGRAKRLLPLLVAVILLAAAPKMGNADSMTFGTGWGEGNGTLGCDGECCALYDLHVTSANVSEIDITLGGGTGDDGCFDKTCFATQLGYLNGVPMATGTVSFVWTATPGVLKITFSPALTYNNMFEFWICKKSGDDLDTCRSFLDWETKDNHGVADSYGHDTILTGCDSYSGPPCGGGCDLAFQSGENTICVELGPLSAGAHCITLHYEVPIKTGCFPTSVNPVEVFNCSCPSCTGSLSSYSNDTFTWCAGGGPTGGCTFPGCTPICFNFPPGCQTIQINHVYVTTDLADNPCDPQVVVFKALPPGGPQPTGQNSGGQNYPNPVDASSGFNTTIPFTTAAGGTASIRIVDAKGNVVMKDDEEVTYAGQHFFYFTAADLPSGTYYYQIEFPQGVVIQNKTMLVVK
jgi:hypothetical protein